jgi:nucleotide-binding universal stress UspA family protein
MWLTKKILAPTDFSEVASYATDTAIELAKTFAVPVVLMHSYEIPVYSYPAIPYVPATDLTESLEQAAKQGLDFVRRKYELSGVEITTVVQIGVAWEQIISTAKNIDAGLIVMGTHGRRGLPRALMGSVAEKVVRLSPIPVLTLREPVAGAGATRSTPNPKAADDLVDRWQL